MDIEWLLSGFLSKVFRRGRDNCNFFVHTNLSLKMFFWNIINFRMSFRPWAKYFGLLSKIYRKCFFLKKNYVFIRGHWAKRLSFLSKGFWRSCENCMPCVYMNTWTATFFLAKNFCFWSILDIERYFLTLYWNFFDEVLKTASYVFIGLFWWKTFVIEKISSFKSFWDLKKLTFKVFFSNFQAGFWQFHSTCP